MKKNRHILTFIGLLAIVVNFSSCFLLFPFSESENGKKDKDTIEKRYATKTNDELKKEGLDLLKTSFSGTFEYKQQIKNEEEFKQFAYYSSELKRT